MRAYFRWIMTAIFITAIVPPGVTRAGGLEPKFIPADAKFILHFDFDALRKSKLWQIALKNMPWKQADAIEHTVNLFGAAPKELHGITLFGPSFEEDQLVLVIRGRLDISQISEVAEKTGTFRQLRPDETPFPATRRMNPTAATFPPTQPSETPKIYALRSLRTTVTNSKGGTLLTTTQPSEVTFFTWPKPDLVVIGRRGDSVARELDVIGGKTTDELVLPEQKMRAMAGGPLLAGAETAGAMLYVAGDDLAALQKQYAASPVLSQLSSAWLTVTEHESDVVVKASLNAKSADAAKQVQLSLEGIKALASLACGSSASNDATVKLVVDALQRAVVTSNGATVTVDWPIALPAIDAMIRANRSPSPTTIPASQPSSAE